VTGPTGTIILISVPSHNCPTDAIHCHGQCKGQKLPKKPFQMEPRIIRRLAAGPGADRRPIRNSQPQTLSPTLLVLYQGGRVCDKAGKISQEGISGSEYDHLFPHATFGLIFHTRQKSGIER